MASRPKRLSPQQMQKACDAFNQAHPIGSTVTVAIALRDDRGIQAKVVEPGAYVLGGHTPVVQIEGRGCFALSHVQGAA